MMTAMERRRQADMRHAGGLPERRFLAPVVRRSRAAGCPHLNADGFRIAALGLRQPVQFAEDVQRRLVRRIGVRHPAVAPFGDARQRLFMMPAIPHRHPAGSRARIDAGIVDRVIPALERHVILLPQRLHDLHLLLGAAAAIMEILVQPDELHLVPAHADPKPEPALAQHVQACRLLRHQSGLALGDDQHAGGEPQSRRQTRQIAQQNERVVEQILGGIAPRLPARP